MSKFKDNNYRFFERIHRHIIHNYFQNVSGSRS